MSTVMVRLMGEETTCRQLLDTLRTAATVEHVDGPVPNRRNDGVRFYAVVSPARQHEPGE